MLSYAYISLQQMNQSTDNQTLNHTGDYQLKFPIDVNGISNSGGGDQKDNITASHRT